MTDMPIMRAAFRTTVSGDGKYEMVFRFPSMDAMHAADDEWRAALNQPPAPVEAVVAYASPAQMAAMGDPIDDQGGAYIPLRKTPAGKFTMPLYAHPPEPAASTVAQGEG